MVVSHVDDFTIGGSKSFIEEVVTRIEAELTVSKIEHGSFRFTGVDVRKTTEGTEVSMDDYVHS